MRLNKAAEKDAPRKTCWSGLQVRTAVDGGRIYRGQCQGVGITDIDLHFAPRSHGTKIHVSRSCDLFTDRRKPWRSRKLSTHCRRFRAVLILTTYWSFEHEYSLLGPKNTSSTDHGHRNREISSISKLSARARAHNRDHRIKFSALNRHCHQQLMATNSSQA